jgi:AcrR family transcriptional regulator
MPAKPGIHEAARRTQILQAARRCIVELGYERVTMRDVAETAGVSTGTIVHYFGDKDTMLEAALLDKVQDTGIAFRAALTGAQTAWERLERLVMASLPETEEVRDEWRLWLTFWGEVARNERLRVVSEKQHRRWTRFLAGIIAQGSASGEFAAVDPEITATQLAALIDGLAIQATLQNPVLSPAQMRQICLSAFQRLLYASPPA